jgi:DNA topoisomerase-1
MSLIIVESPTKARTFNRLLKGQNEKYFVFATMGHIRDLPSKSLAIDYKNNFQPKYEVIKNKKKIVEQLKKLAKENNEIILATDPDREGESIAYHIAYLLGFYQEKWPNFLDMNKEKKLKRIVFHEITKKALDEALRSPSSIRLPLVKAQIARRLLDRIVGYELSPLLWKKIGKNWLSAGRVQTIALRLIVEREREIENFLIEDFYRIKGLFEIKKNNVEAKLITFHNQSVEKKETLTLFAGPYQFSKTVIDKKNVNAVVNELKNDSYKVLEIKEEVINRYPPPPFITSTLQQEAFYRFGFSSKMTMKLAQDLFEQGYITYHRTDSFNLSTNFVFKAKDYIEKKFGKDYTLEKPRGYKTKSKLAQEAHEAIRPTRLEEIDKKAGLTINHLKLYRLIFDRAVATQMKEAKIKTIKITIGSDLGNIFLSESQEVIFDGFLKLLQPDFSKKNFSPKDININEKANLNKIEPILSTTQPPPRYNEASLIKILEEKGIGRPSTYATILATIQNRYYVEKENRYFKPTKLGQAIVDYLSKAFVSIFQIDFTAQMEDKLDEITQEKVDFVKLLSDFYSPFSLSLKTEKEKKEVIDVEEDIKENCPQCGVPLTIRYSRFGKFFACSRYPDCKFTKSFHQKIAGKKCPKCGGDIVVKFSKKKKRFYSCANWPKCDYVGWKLKT